MRFQNLAALVALSLSSTWSITAASPTTHAKHVERATVITPKVFIISMFTPEADIWYGIPDFNVLAQNITVPGFSPLFKQAHCTADGQICQMTTGEGEINAASGVSALILSPLFDLRKTYFLIAGIAGVNPEVATLGSVTFARYAVQVALQFELDAREIPANFSTGYFPQGTTGPGQYPQEIYGTEVFELSLNLQRLAIGFAGTASLNDSSEAASYRSLYANVTSFTAGASPPSITACDVATADNFWSGTLLSQAFANTTKLFTNSSGLYCTSAQEDNATLEALLRGALSGLVDFTRIMLMRTASDFDRPPPSLTALQNLVYEGFPGFLPAIQNIYLAGSKVVMGIVGGWNATFDAGVSPGNYVGDIFDSLGGTPDFGLPSKFISGGAGMRRRRSGGVKKRSVNVVRRTVGV